MSTELSMMMTETHTYLGMVKGSKARSEPAMSLCHSVTSSREPNWYNYSLSLLRRMELSERMKLPPEVL